MSGGGWRRGRGGPKKACKARHGSAPAAPLCRLACTAVRSRLLAWVAVTLGRGRRGRARVARWAGLGGVCALCSRPALQRSTPHVSGDRMRGPRGASGKKGCVANAPSRGLPAPPPATNSRLHRRSPSITSVPRAASDPQTRARACLLPVPRPCSPFELCRPPNMVFCPTAGLGASHGFWSVLLALLQVRGAARGLRAPPQARRCPGGAASVQHCSARTLQAGSGSKVAGRGRAAGALPPRAAAGELRRQLSAGMGPLPPAVRALKTSAAPSPPLPTTDSAVGGHCCGGQRGAVDLERKLQLEPQVGAGQGPPVPR